MRIMNTYESPIGTMVMCCEDGKLTDLCMEKNFNVIGLKRKESEVFDLCRKQLDEYFAGSRKEFSVPLDLRGSEFRHKVWKVLETIPYGETVTYHDVAAAIGKPLAYRAVGCACRGNPVLIMLPCHRVLGYKGNIGGYSAGVEMKQYLLELEKKHK